jgi:hypothetical protein
MIGANLGSCRACSGVMPSSSRCIRSNFCFRVSGSFPVASRFAQSAQCRGTRKWT